MDLHESATALNQNENRRNALKGKRAAHDATSTYGKSEDRKNKIDQLTSFCNDELRYQYDHKDKYLQHRLSHYMFMVKRDYKEYDPTSDEDVDHFTARCQAVLDNAKDCKVGAGKRERKFNDDIIKKRLGAKKGNIKQYKEIFLHVAGCVLARFEHTRVVKIVKMNNGDLVMVCSCPVWEKNMVEHAGTCTRF